MSLELHRTKFIKTPRLGLGSFINCKSTKFSLRCLIENRHSAETEPIIIRTKLDGVNVRRNVLLIFIDAPLRSAYVFDHTSIDHLNLF